MAQASLPPCGSTSAGAGIEGVQHAVVAGNVEHGRAPGLGCREGAVAGVDVGGKGSPHVDGLAVDNVTQHVVALR